MIHTSTALHPAITGRDMVTFYTDVMGNRPWASLYPSIEVPNIHIYACSFKMTDSLNCRIRISFAVNGIERVWTNQRATGFYCESREITKEVKEDY